MVKHIINQKKNKDPFIDIVIPNYNKGNYLDKAIKSVINQTYNKWKLILLMITQTILH